MFDECVRCGSELFETFFWCRSCKGNICESCSTFEASLCWDCYEENRLDQQEEKWKEEHNPYDGFTGDNFTYMKSSRQNYRRKKHRRAK